MLTVALPERADIKTERADIKTERADIETERAEYKTKPDLKTNRNKKFIFYKPTIFGSLPRFTFWGKLIECSVIVSYQVP